MATKTPSMVENEMVQTIRLLSGAVAMARMRDWLETAQVVETEIEYTEALLKAHREEFGQLVEDRAVSV